jgi:glycosyltransferase involved in cell wall biosynthesis
VHCRSYIAADVGLYLKKKFGVKFFFDMRGFWADEKKDGGSWNVKNPIFKRIYQYYKKKEEKYIQNADYIISLTEAGKNELCSWPSYKSTIPVKVIPCCTDMNHFSLTDFHQKTESRSMLSISDSALVISYLGSIGTWYMIDEMLVFFRQLKSVYPDAKFLFVTHSDPLLIQRKANALQLNLEDFIIREATRKEVPQLIKASDINISFIKPVYSKISSSPTKLGEVLSMGIPVICNSGVGDVEKVITRTETGYILHHFSTADFEKAIKAIPSLMNKKPQEIRDKAEDVYNLNKGIALYRQSYQSLFN